MKLVRAHLADLEAQAQATRLHAHAPYSKYRVGAALLTRRGAYYAGCNVENASYGATLCAERAAIAAMVAAGDRDPIACAVVTGGRTPGAPCGICRQVLAEFARDMVIALVAVDDDGRVTARSRVRLQALLPLAFRLRQDKSQSASRPRERNSKTASRPRERNSKTASRPPEGQS